MNAHRVLPDIDDLDSKLVVPVNVRISEEEALDLDRLRAQTPPGAKPRSRSDYLRMAFKIHCNWVRATMLGYAMLRKLNPFFELKACKRL